MSDQMTDDLDEQTRWLDIGRLQEIPRRGARQIVTPWMRIAVFRTSDDQIFALEDRCPHKDGPLSQGIVHGASVTCPLHNWVIGLESGTVQGPDDGCVRTLAVKVTDDRIELGLPKQTAAA